jgi:uncharacterized membrane protein
MSGKAIWIIVDKAWVKMDSPDAHLGGRMEFNISSVCDVVFSTAGFFCPFFPFAFVMLTKIGVWYLTSDVVCMAVVRNQEQFA